MPWFVKERSMWKRITFVIGLALVSLAGLAAYLGDKTYLRSGHVAVAPAVFERRYKPQDLRARLRVPHLDDRARASEFLCHRRPSVL
jgi:hypothetical protein